MSNKWRHIGSAESAFGKILPPYKELVENTETGEQRAVWVGSDETVDEAIAKGQWADDNQDESYQSNSDSTAEDRWNYKNDQSEEREDVDKIQRDGARSKEPNSASSSSTDESIGYGGGAYTSTDNSSGGAVVVILVIIGALWWLGSKTDTDKQPANSNPLPTTPAYNSPQHEPEILYVNTQQMKLRSGPGVQFSDIGRVSFGDAVNLAESAISTDGGSWVKVTTDTVSGWLNKKFLSTTPGLEMLNQICVNTDFERIELFKEITRGDFGLIGPTSSREGGICNVVNNMEIKKIDLNNDGLSEFIVYPGFGCGINNCDSYVFQTTEKGYKSLLVSLGNGIDIKDDFTNGYRDLYTKAHASAMEYEIHTYGYYMDAYKEKDCWLYKQLENGKTIGRKCSDPNTEKTSAISAQSPSYNCGQAKTDVEITVCNNPELSSMDEEMAELYRSHKKDLPVDVTKKLIDTQKSWLSTRKRCGRNVGCLHARYQERIMWLKEYEPYD